jgi:hypothetical protein
VCWETGAQDEEVRYDFDELDALTHAHAISFHRSQGSEYPCVVVPLMTSAWMVLQRNLLYTAVTRAKRAVVLVGSWRAIAKAVRTTGAGRYTGLAQRPRTTLDACLSSDSVSIFRAKLARLLRWGCPDLVALTHICCCWRIHGALESWSA